MLLLSYFMWQSYLGSTKQSQPTQEMGIWSSDPFHEIYFCDLKRRIWTWKSEEKNIPFRRPGPQMGLLSPVDFSPVWDNDDAIRFMAPPHIVVHKKFD